MNNEKFQTLVLKSLQIILTDQDGTEVYNEIEEALNPSEPEDKLNEIRVKLLPEVK